VQHLVEDIPRSYQISPLREHSFEAVEEHIVELHDVLISLTQDINRVYGLDGENPIVHSDMNFNTQRATNLKDPVGDQDAVTLNYLRRWLIAYEATGAKPGDRF
jgi:hypothetical protein